MIQKNEYNLIWNYKNFVRIYDPKSVRIHIHVRRKPKAYTILSRQFPGSGRHAKNIVSLFLFIII